MVRHHHATESSLVDLFLPLSNTQFSQFGIEVFPQTYSLPRLRINRTLKRDFINTSVFSLYLTAISSNLLLYLSRVVFRSVGVCGSFF